MWGHSSVDRTEAEAGMQSVVDTPYYGSSPSHQTTLTPPTAGEGESPKTGLRRQLWQSPKSLVEKTPAKSQRKQARSTLSNGIRITTLLPNTHKIEIDNKHPQYHQFYDPVTERSYAQKGLDAPSHGPATQEELKHLTNLNVWPLIRIDGVFKIEFKSKFKCPSNMQVKELANSGQVAIHTISEFKDANQKATSFVTQKVEIAYWDPTNSVLRCLRCSGQIQDESWHAVATKLPSQCKCEKPNDLLIPGVPKQKQFLYRSGNGETSVYCKIPRERKQRDNKWLSNLPSPFNLGQAPRVMAIKISESSAKGGLTVYKGFARIAAKNGCMEPIRILQKRQQELRNQAAKVEKGDNHKRKRISTSAGKSKSKKTENKKFQQTLTQLWKAEPKLDVGESINVTRIAKVIRRTQTTVIVEYKDSGKMEEIPIRSTAFLFSKPSMSSIGRVTPESFSSCNSPNIHAMELRNSPQKQASAEEAHCAHASPRLSPRKLKMTRDSSPRKCRAEQDRYIAGMLLNLATR